MEPNHSAFAWRGDPEWSMLRLSELRRGENKTMTTQTATPIPLRLARLALLLTLGGALAALFGALVSGWGGWSFRTGFAILRYAFYAAAAGGVLALVALAWSRFRTKGAVVASLAALIVALGFCGYVLSLMAQAKGVPAIHEISTDPADPPAFRTLPVRGDNLDAIPDLDRPDLARMDPAQRLKAVQRIGYPDIATRHLTVPPTQAYKQALALAKARDWAIARADPNAGMIEATDTVSLFRFKDDVAIRVRPDPARSGGSLVDMRSISRVGTSDLGVNARRVRDFLRNL